MVSSVYWEWNLLIESLKLGVRLGLIYDGFRLFRILITHHRFIIDLEDIIYWIISTFLIFRMQIRLADGITRGFVIASILVGMWIYHKLFGRRWVPVVEKKVLALKQWLTKLTAKIRIKKKDNSLPHDQSPKCRLWKKRRMKEADVQQEERT